MREGTDDVNLPPESEVSRDGSDLWQKIKREEKVAFQPLEEREFTHL